MEYTRLEDVIAIVAGGFIYCSELLLSDPRDIYRKYGEIRHIIGNIGRAGIALLLPPADPMVRKRDDSTWNTLPMPVEYDSTEIDSFSGSTIQLSFTGLRVTAVDVDVRGGQEVFYLETRLSLYNRGNWMADLDVLGLSNSIQRSKIGDLETNASQLNTYLTVSRDPRREASLTHTTVNIYWGGDPCDCKTSSSVVQYSGSRLVSVDSWDELLDPPVGVGVFRAKENWMTRLAACSLALQRGIQSFILFRSPNHPICLGCLQTVCRHMKIDPVHSHTIVIN